MNIGEIVHAIVHFIFVLAGAYLVWAAAARSDGLMKQVGNVLAIVVAVLGLVFLVGTATAPMFGGHPFGVSLDGPAVSAPASAGEGDEAAAPSEDAGAKPGADEAPAAKP